MQIIACNYAKVGENMSVTLKDIAEKAGVSVSTVSRVINNKTKSASDETKKEIWQLANNMGYKRKYTNKISSNEKKETKKIGYLLLCPRPNMLNVFDDPFFSVLIKGIEEEVKNRGYSIIFSHKEEELLKNKDIYHKVIHEIDADGIIIINDYLNINLYSKLKNNYKNIVLINNRNKKIKETTLRINREQITYKAIKYLIENNHKQIGFIGGKIRNYPLEKQERFRGYKKALTEAGININKDYIKISNWEIENGYNNMKNLLENKKIPTAIFCASDLISIGAMHAIQETGLDIPEDISIISYDNIKVSAFLNPPLTTIHAPKKELGKVAVDVLDMVIKNRINIPLNISLPANLIIRKSVKKL